MQQGLARATFEEKRKLVELLIDRVVVTNDEVEIRYVIPTSPQSEQVRFMHLRSDYFDAPNLIGFVDHQPLEQVREDLMARLGEAQVGLGGDAFDAHLAHLPLHLFAIDQLPFASQAGGNAP